MGKANNYGEATQVAATNAGGTIGGAVVGGAMNILGSYLNNKMASQRENQARNDNFLYGEMAAENAQQRTIDLYNSIYSPSAQVQQLKDAGLSPSLFYGQASGMQGQAGPQGGGPGNITPNVFGIDLLQGAQFADLMASAELKKEKANELTGNNKMGLAEIAEKYSAAGFNEAGKKLRNAEKEQIEWQNYITENTADFEIRRAESLVTKTMYETREALWAAKTAKIDFDFKNENFENALKKALAETDLTISLKKLNDSNINKNEMEINKWEKELTINFEKVGYDMMNAESRKEFNNVLDKWYDEQYEMLKKRLEFDEVAFVSTIIKESAFKLLDTIISILSSYL